MSALPDRPADGELISGAPASTIASTAQIMHEVYCDTCPECKGVVYDDHAQADAALAAAMDPALGPDRLVVAGPFEQEIERLTTALHLIHDNAGSVCSTYETCAHDACESSYTAWALADQALRAAPVFIPSPERTT